ncbi:TIR domain-containing protein [Colwellia sp. BRX10-6]|uniref:TIR domain-containing protein n=1 Tax=unclassified Colwellia TaxID=196834 RepID=UPI0015F74311|nr:MULTISPECIES: TIR domain-containing protein [unclassified Colwellia]MBA6385043.1 TIR domain-containing protein [Colwellia sp. BRX10-9]MBA6395700.1 TIR domain-containing protein [Colwellia sp. BRX10-6]
MARQAFFSFKYKDVSKAMTVRNSWATQGKQAAGFIDAADFEEVKRKGDNAIKNWIDKQLEGTSVTVVLVGDKTCSSRWVKYEIEKSIERGNGLLGIDVSKIKNFQGKTSERCGKIPNGYAFYLWNSDDGYNNMGNWIEKAAKDAGR